MKVSDIDSSVMEMASAGASCSSSIASVANPTKKRKNRKLYNPDGTIKNAADVGDNIFGGKTIKRKQT